MIILGDYSDEVTGLGLAGSIFLSVLGLDLPADIRDLTACFTVNFDPSDPMWWMNLGSCAVSFLPLVGGLKYVDEGAELLKYSDEAAEAAGDVGKHLDEVVEGGSPPLPVENKKITGMDWYDYFRETYGKENVCWESCNPSEVATAWQGSYPYVGVDTYTNTTLHDGDIIWMGEPFPTGYSTTTEAIADLGNDAHKVFGGLQVKPYYEKGMPFAEYRSSLTPYKVHGELNVAEGFALNNPQFGAGGLAQRFDPNFDYNYANGFLERLEEQAIELTNTRVSLEDYFNMMDEIK